MTTSNLKGSIEELKRWVQKDEPRKDSDEKMSEIYNVNKIAEEFKVPVDVAEKAAKELFSTIKTALPSESDDVYRVIFAQKIGKAFKKGDALQYAKENAPAHVGVVLAVSKFVDRNKSRKNKIMREFKKPENKSEYITNGLVEMRARDDGSEYPVALDNTKEFKDGSPNPNFGKPIPFERQREIFMVTDDGEMLLVRGDLETVPLGKKVTFYGNKRAPRDNETYVKGTVRAWKGVLEVSDAAVDATELWNNYIKAGATDLGMELKAVRELPSWGFFITQGFISSLDFGEEGNKIAIELTNEEEYRPVKLTSSYGPLVEIGHTLSEGDDVIVWGGRDSFKGQDGQYHPYNMLLGVVRNPKSLDITNAMKKMNELGI